MKTIYLALGSNVGDSKTYIARAIELMDEKLSDIRQAPLYATKPMGYEDQADFVNTAIEAKTDMEPLSLLTFLKDIEVQVGRQERFRWGPREIDIDIIFYGQQTFSDQKLTIPHPRFSERDFVLRPLLDLNMQLVDPVSGAKLSEIITNISDEQSTLREN